MSLHLMALGGTKVVHDGEVLDAFRQQSLRSALLFLVGVEGETTRETVAAMLWPDKEPDRARHSLSQAVYELNRELSPAPIETAGDVIRLSSRVSVDVVEFEAAVEAGEHERALELYSGEFLAGTYLASTRGFESWTDRVRSRLSRLSRDAARGLVAARREASDLDAALAAAERWAELDPLDDEAQHALIELLAQHGRRSEALRRFEEYSRLLDDELEIEPLEHTVELVERIRATPARPADVDAIITDAAVASDAPAPADEVVSRDAPGQPDVPMPADAPAPTVAAAADTPVGDERPRSILSELKERKVFRTAVFYAVVVFAVLEGADLILPTLGVPSWVFTALVVVAVVAFPVTLILSWVFDMTPQGVEETKSHRVHAGRAARALQIVLVGMVVLASLGLGALTLRRLLTPSDGYNPNRIVVYPLVIRDPGIDRTVGEEVATLIGNALDGTGPLRWIDGWPLLSGEQRENVRSLLLEDAHALAAGRDAGLLVIGSLQSQGDSTVVSLDLRDTAGDSLLARASAAGLATEAWRLGLQAVNGLLPRLIPTEVADFGVAFTDRNPEAVASFLLAEASARRSSYEEALDLYRRAFAADSLFALAALRGAQAAGWKHRSREAEDLIRAAIKLPLSDRDRHFALGVMAFLEGNADKALRSLRSAVDVDQEMALAHVQIGEVYTHLVPRRFHPDSADVAFSRAMAMDPAAINVLLHPIESALRAGDLERAESMLDRFVLTGPEEWVERELRIMLRCVEGGPGAVEWTREARAAPLEVLHAAMELAEQGAALSCAEPGLRAVLEADTATDAFGNGRRWNALYSLQSLLFAEGRDEEAIDLMRAATSSLGVLRTIAAGEPTDLLGVPTAEQAGCELDSSQGVSSSEVFLLVDETVGFEIGSLADRVACQYERRYGAGYVSTSTPIRLWVLGIHEASRGNSELVAQMADRIRLGVAGAADPRGGQLLAEALDGHAALSRGDSATAIERFRRMRPRGTVADLEWDIAAPLGLEQILLSRLLLASGEHQEALWVAEALDASPSAYLLYLPASLEIRSQAADSLGFSTRADAYRQRLVGLRGATASR